jgi:hypothetical protein
MSRFQIGDIVHLDGSPARVVWLREDANEIEPMDEYIVEFEDKRRRFILSSAVNSQQGQTIRDRKPYGDRCEGQTH